MSLGINSPVHYIDHAEVRNLHRIAMNILENAIEKQTTFKVVSEIKTEVVTIPAMYQRGTFF